MFNQTLNEFLTSIDYVVWTYFGIYFVILSGLYFSIRSRGFQFEVLTSLSFIKHLYSISKDKTARGINPFKLYFASIGGMIGLGNLVVIVTAVTSGGPGALFWMWVATFAGMMIKYAEIYLGVKFRQDNKKGGYDGGPMFYLKEAFGNKWLPIASCVLLCIYGAEVMQFKIITDTVSQTFDLNWLLVACIIAALVLYASIGGVRRLASICTVLMPFFMGLYVVMCFYVIFQDFGSLSSVLWIVVKSALTGHAAVAGFAGSTALAAMHFGVARAVYSGDIGIGYDSIVQSETKSKDPEPQARLAIFGLFTDMIIGTCTVLVVLLTGAWKDPRITEPSLYIIKSLSLYFPYVEIFMCAMFFVVGYATVIAYFTIGIKCASFINAKVGREIYIVYGMSAFLLTKFVDQNNLVIIMSIAGGLLVIMNVSAIIKLRKLINFSHKRLHSR
jgi:AGCS family alanine or glycine:cation symporter